MAAGEYVSVSSQADSERADIARERRELQDDPASELEELAGIYGKRGLDADLAHRVAEQLMERDALGAHERDELGISPATTARPVQAALASAGSFAIGAALPLLLMIVAPVQTLVGSLHRVPTVSGTAPGGRGKSGRRTDTQGDHPRYVLGALAMAATAGIGVAFGKRI